MVESGISLGSETQAGYDSDEDASDQLGGGEGDRRRLARRWIANPEGRNQFTDCPSKKCPDFLQLLRSYHKITTNRQEVKALLEKEHDIYVSERTISRRWQEMGLKGSAAMEAILSPGRVAQIVADHMGADPAGRIGKSNLKKQIALRTGIHLRRKTVGEIQRILDPDGVAARHPTARRIRRVPLLSDGPNDVWCCDGHDKLCKYGFAIWGVRDKFSRKWLGLWVLPNNRIAVVVAYLWLSLVLEIGGMPKQASSDCGTENTYIYGLANALRDAFSDDVPEKPAHIFLRSVHHIPIERGWLDLRREFNDNFTQFWEVGRGVYDEDNLTHRHLVMWLWPPLMQRELDRFRMEANNKRVRKQKNKALPSGVAPNLAYTLPEHFGASDCLQPVDTRVIREILREPELQEGKDLLNDWGVPDWFANEAEAALQTLHVKEITLHNVWIIFHALLAFFA